MTDYAAKAQKALQELSSANSPSLLKAKIKNEGTTFLQKFQQENPANKVAPADKGNYDRTIHLLTRLEEHIENANVGPKERVALCQKSLNDISEKSLNDISEKSLKTVSGPTTNPGFLSQLSSLFDQQPQKPDTTKSFKNN